MIQFYSRATQTIQTEKVLGGGWVDFAYQNRLGRFMTDWVLSRKWISQAMGAYQDSHLSARAIDSFVKGYDINLDEYEDGPFDTFNDFFIRKFRDGVRPFSNQPLHFCAGAEARYLVRENVTNQTTFPVKGIQIQLSGLLDSSELANEFLGGTIVIARLCPVDYHRFHFPISGTWTKWSPAHGPLDSVNPVALKSKPEILFRNERQISIFSSRIFGKVAMIEVGALGVGKIVQSHVTPMPSPDWPPVQFELGEEKGYFLFGGSTVIWVMQAGKFQADADLIENSNQGLETWVPLGERIGEGKSAER